MNTFKNEYWIFSALGLGALAVYQPLYLYLTALAVFGLPHVLWELAWLRKVWSNALPKVFWGLMASALGLQVTARLLLMNGKIDGATGAACDAVTLALALLSTLILAPKIHRRRRTIFVILAMLLPLGLIAITDTPYIFGLIVLLSIAHNFTPIGLVPRNARIANWPARGVLLIVFSGPILLFLLLLSAGSTHHVVSAGLPVEVAWVNGWFPSVGTALLPALVWAQCLHYISVLHLMPRMLGTGWGRLPLRSLALGCSGLLTAMFITDFASTRPIYGLAAGLHAWLEWPIILLVIFKFNTSLSEVKQAPTAVN